jgi:hypothetical protein
MEASVNEKQKAERVHAKRRAKSRYNLDFTKEVRRAFNTIIHNNKAKFLWRQSRRVSVFEVPYENKTYKVVYDKLRGEIVTFLPSEDIGDEVPIQ